MLVIALTGNAVTCALFGTCTSFPEAIAVRLIMGVFNGAVGYVVIISFLEVLCTLLTLCVVWRGVR